MLHTAHRYTNLCVSASLLGKHPDGYPEMAQAFHEAIEPGGPDDFYILKSGLEGIYNALSLQQLLIAQPQAIVLERTDRRHFITGIPPAGEELRRAKRERG